MNHHHYHLNKNTNSLFRMLLAAVFTGILMGGDHHHRSFLATTMAFSATTTTTNLLHTINIHQSSSFSFSLYGYLDNLSRDELYDTRGDPNPDGNESREDTQMSKDQLDRYGPGDLSSFVDFGDEFDGGDGRRYFCILVFWGILLLSVCVRGARLDHTDNKLTVSCIFNFDFVDCGVDPLGSASNRVLQLF